MCRGPFSAAARVPSAGILPSRANLPSWQRLYAVQTAGARGCIEKEVVMTRFVTIALSMLAGAALGAAAVQGLHAQAKPPIYVVTEIDVTDVDTYLKDYAPKAQALIRASGGRVLAGGQNVTSLDG